MQDEKVSPLTRKSPPPCHLYSLWRSPRHSDPVLPFRRRGSLDVTITCSVSTVTYIYTCTMSWHLCPRMCICSINIMRANLSYASTSGRVRKQFYSESTPISNKLLAQSVGARNAISTQFSPLGLSTMYEPILFVDFWISMQKCMCGIFMLIWMLGRFDRISSII